MGSHCATGDARQSTAGACSRGRQAGGSAVRLNKTRCSSGRASRRGSMAEQRHRSLLQCGAIASHASNVLPGSGAQFHRDEATRQAVYAETPLCLSIQTFFGNSTRSSPPTMGAAKRNGPSVRRGHAVTVVAVRDRFVRRLRADILCGQLFRLFGKLEPLADELEPSCLVTLSCVFCGLPTYFGLPAIVVRAVV
jgi:hypothetical protein